VSDVSTWSRQARLAADHVQAEELVTAGGDWARAMLFDGKGRILASSDGRDELTGTFCLQHDGRLARIVQRDGHGPVAARPRLYVTCYDYDDRAAQEGYAFHHVDLVSRHGGVVSLMFSDDYGATWQNVPEPLEDSCDYFLGERFAGLAFVGFGPGYSGVPERFGNYVYALSNDDNWETGDNIFVARVPRDRILERSAWEFYGGTRDGQPDWDLDVVAGPAGALLFALDLAYTPDPEERVFKFGPARLVTFRFPLPAYLRAPAEVFRVDADGVTQVEQKVNDGGVEIRDRVSRVAIYVVAAQEGERARIESRRLALMAKEEALGFDPAGKPADLAVLQEIARRAEK